MIRASRDFFTRRRRIADRRGDGQAHVVNSDGKRVKDYNSKYRPCETVSILARSRGSLYKSDVFGKSCRSFAHSFRFKLETERVTVNRFLLLMSTAFTSTGARVINIDCFARVYARSHSLSHAAARIYASAELGAP